MSPGRRDRGYPWTKGDLLFAGLVGLHVGLQVALEHRKCRRGDCISTDKSHDRSVCTRRGAGRLGLAARGPTTAGETDRRVGSNDSIKDGVLRAAGLGGPGKEKNLLNLTDERRRPRAGDGPRQ